MKISLLALALLAYSMHTLAFSAAGHEAVCEIAYQELTPAAKAAVDGLVAEENDDRFKTLRDACVWPDVVGSTGGAVPSRRNDHYINVPRWWFYIRYENCYEADSCLFTAIRRDESTLRDDQAADAEKWRALKYLGHWMGDIHQPLHVSFRDDRGGNDILLENGIGCRKKLHAVWDECIPEDLMKSMGLDPDETDQRKDFGENLRNQITDAQRATWTGEERLERWASESFAIARLPDTKYCTLEGNRCAYSEDSFQHISHGESENTRTLELTGAYEDQFNELIRERIQMAGVRFGALLNRVFQ